MASVKATCILEIDNQQLDSPIVKRLECGQLALLDPQTFPPATPPTAFLPSTVDVKKVWLLRSDKRVNVYATSADNFLERVLTINPGGFILAVDIDLGDLRIENPDAEETANVEQLAAGAAF